MGSHLYCVLQAFSNVIFRTATCAAFDKISINWHSASRGPSAIVELLVEICERPTEWDRQRCSPLRGQRGKVVVLKAYTIPAHLRPRMRGHSGFWRVAFQLCDSVANRNSSHAWQMCVCHDHHITHFMRFERRPTRTHAWYSIGLAAQAVLRKSSICLRRRCRRNSSAATVPRIYLFCRRVFGWRCGVVVTALVASTKLLYVEPG